MLSPLLYSVYSHDFPVTVPNNTKTRFFADDTAVWTMQRTSEAASQEIQRALDNIQRWTTRWRIKLNPAKSTAILFRHPHLTRNRRLDPNHVHLSSNNQPIPLSNQARYLGITFQHTCSLYLDLQETLRKARNRSNLLRRIQGRFRGCDVQSLLHTYNTFIRPILDYRAPIYASLKPRLFQLILSTERKILRRIFRLHFRHPSDQVYPDTETIPITDRLVTLQQNYITRTLNAINNPIAIETLQTSAKPLNRLQVPVNRIPRKPRSKLKHPPAALLTSLYPNLPAHLHDLVEDTPLNMR